MAIQSRSITPRTRDIQTDGKRQMNIHEFKQWLMTFDTNRDGRISKDELKKALRSVGGWYHAWRNTDKGLYADANGDGLIDDEEIYNLLDFAEQCMGVRIIAY